MAAPKNALGATANVLPVGHAASPLMFAGFGDHASIGITLGGGPIGFAGGETHELRLSTALLDDPTLVRAGMAFGSLFLLPGSGETMRVNGRVSEVRDDEIRVAVEECNGHCGKALIRPEFWAASPTDIVQFEAAGHLGASRFHGITEAAQDHSEPRQLTILRWRDGR